MNNRLGIAITAYGNEYVNYLKVLLESLMQNMPGCDVVVFYDNIDSEHIHYMAKKAIQSNLFGVMEFVPVQTNIITMNRDVKVPRKLDVWELMLHYMDNQKIVLADVDMLFIKDFKHLFTNDFDVAFTYKDNVEDKWPLNTGLMLVNRSDKALAFFNWMRLKVVDICNNAVELNHAKRKWGAVDQAVLGEYVWEPFFKDGSTLFELMNLKFKGIPCSILNETRCVPISPDTHVIHYKGGWRKVLNTNQFTNNRPMDKCKAMFDLWHKYRNSFDGRN